MKLARAFLIPSGLEGGGAMIRVLLVEDDEKVARRVQFLLKDFGYEADVAGGVGEALDLAMSARYRVVLLDWMLPDGEGTDVVRRIRSSGVRTPVIMLTGRSSVPDRVEALQAGADDYVVKPFDIRELAARVEAVLRRTDGALLLGTLRHGRITLHVESHEVWVDGSRLDLTYLEFRLLAYLMRERGEALSRGRILAEVWGMNNDLGSNVVDVHIARLREKLGRARDQIETVRGVGYRLGADVGTV